MKTLFLIVFTSLLGLLVQAQDYKGTNSKTRGEILNEEYCSGIFNTTDGTILDLTDNLAAKGYLNILDWLQGRVAGLQVFQTRNGISVPVIRGGVPGVFIDEVQVSPATLNSLNVNDIAIIKIIKTPFYGGFNSGNGAIAIYTKNEENEDQ